MQKFRASVRHTPAPNGAIGWAPGGWADCLGPWAKVENCPIVGTDIRRTAYATDYADTYFGIPAACRYKGKRIPGYFTLDDGNPVFNPMESHAHVFRN